MLCDLPGHGWQVALIPSVDFRRGGQRLFGLSLKQRRVSRQGSRRVLVRSFRDTAAEAKLHFTAKLPTLI